MALPDVSEILDDHRFTAAVVRINKRAERQTDPAKLAEVFVQTDLPARCESLDHQLILGRRGTGKTHLLRFFQFQKQTSGEVVHYCDCTRLGSGLPSVSTEPVEIASKYFSAFLNDLGTALLDHTVLLECPDERLQDRVLGKLSEGLVKFMAPEEQRGLSIFNYRQISDTLSSILHDLKIDRLFLILDEWAQIPLAAQPYVAEFIKRAILTVQRISAKILAVNYQCKFADNVDGNLVGMQRGADFTDIIDLDRYLIYDEKDLFVAEFFGQLLHNHLGAEFGWDLGIAKQQKVQVIKRLFTQESAFTELVRAAEGNCRDFSCIFSKAFLEEFKRSQSSKSISIPQICNASASWFSSEKESNIKTEPLPQATLSFLLNDVLKMYKSRSFLVETGKDEHPRLIRLLNERIIHRLNEVYSHPDKPGLRYEIFTLDHGAYVRFRGTVNEPKQNVSYFLGSATGLTSDESASIVPFDDKRSIRRIVFDPDRLNITA